MSLLRSLCLLAPLLGTPTALVAQAASVPLEGPAPSLLFGARTDGPLRAAWAPDSVHRWKPTYAKEGAIVGGVLGAIAGGLFGQFVCELSEDPNMSCTRTVLLGIIGGAPAGALPGALVGGLFPKEPKSKKSSAPE
jgi:hypothetical protein